MSDRAVFDCMVFLQAVINANGPAFACFCLVEDGHVVLCVSAETLAEAQDVLTRPALQAKFPHLTLERVQAFLQNVRAKAIFIDAVPKTISHSRDPDDEPYLNLAVAANAAFLVSRDKDLLDLMNDSGFCSHWPALTILDPVAFLQTMRSRLAEKTGPVGH